MAVEGNKHRDMRPGRVTGDGDARRVAATRGDVVDRPADRGGGIVDERREAYRRNQPVIGHDDDEAPRRDRPRGKGIAAAVSRIPPAAIEEHDNRKRPRRV